MMTGQEYDAMNEAHVLPEDAYLTYESGEEYDAMNEAHTRIHSNQTQWMD
jgi:hypothetical protein